MPQSHVCVLWLPEVGMVLSPKKYVLLRAKVLEMNSKSLEVVEARFAHGPLPLNDAPHALRARLQHRARNLLPDLIPPSEVGDAQGGLLKQ